MVKFSFVFIICLYLATSESLKFALYYESLCPGCRRFITTQLYQAYKTIGPYLEWNFIPYGHAQRRKVNGKWSFTCQHGPAECLGNKGEACGLDLASTVMDQVEYVHCVESSDSPGSIQILHDCCEQANLKWPDVFNCLTNGTGDDLLAHNGELTDNVNPRLQYVPAVVFNDVFNGTLAKEALDNLLRTICKLLNYGPKPCNDFVREDFSVVLIH